MEFFVLIAIVCTGVVIYLAIDNYKKNNVDPQIPVANEVQEKELPQVFKPIIDVGDSFSFLKVSTDGESIAVSLKTNTIDETKLALEEVKLLKSTAQTVKKSIKAEMTEIRQAYQNKVANRSAMIPGGGKFGTIARYAIRAQRAAERGQVTDTLDHIQNTYIDPIDKLILHCDKMRIALKKEIISS